MRFQASGLLRNKTDLQEGIFPGTLAHPLPLSQPWFPFLARDNSCWYEWSRCKAETASLSSCPSVLTRGGCLPCWGKNLFWGLPPPSAVLITPVFPVPLELLDFHPSGLKSHYYLLTPWQFCGAEACVSVHAYIVSCFSGESRGLFSQLNNGRSPLTSSILLVRLNGISIIKAVILER